MLLEIAGLEMLHRVREWGAFKGYNVNKCHFLMSANSHFSNLVFPIIL